MLCMFETSSEVSGAYHARARVLDLQNQIILNLTVGNGYNEFGNYNRCNQFPVEKIFKISFIFRLNLEKERERERGTDRRTLDVSPLRGTNTRHTTRVHERSLRLT